MHAILNRVADRSRHRRRDAVTKPGVICESLEERALLSGLGGALSGMSLRSSRAAEMSLIGAGRQYGMFGGGSLGLGGGMSNPILLLTAPLLEGGSGSTALPTRSVISSSAVQTALQTLQSDLNNDITVGSQPTHASVGALEDTIDAIRKGTLSGTAAQTQIQTDQAAILSGMGLTQAQITQIQSDVTALQSAFTPASSSATSTSTSTSTSSTASSAGASGTTSTTASSTSSSGTASTTASSTSSSNNWSAVQTAIQTLKTDLQNDTPSGAQPTHASVGAVEDDLDAIQKGTLTGTAAVTQVQTDTAAVLSSMGLTATQISQIQADQQAVQTAIEANSTNSSPSTTTASTASTSSSSSTATIAEVQSTLQAVSGYLIGIPGVSTIGMPGMGGGNFSDGFGGGFGGGGGGGFGGGFARGPRGGF
jgi:hypothetical protein